MGQGKNYDFFSTAYQFLSIPYPHTDIKSNDIVSKEFYNTLPQSECPSDV